MNNRYGRGLILAITTPKSLKVKDNEIYYVESETRQGTKYRVNFEDGDLRLHGLSKERRSLQTFLQDCNGEGDSSMMSQG